MKNEAGLEASRRQRSHVLFVLSGPNAGSEQSFREWYRGRYSEVMSRTGDVLSASQYEQHEVDVTRGRYPPVPFQYLGLYDLCLDGAEQAERVIEIVSRLHQETPGARLPATWLYYPVSEKVGRPASLKPSMLTLAFANGLPGRDEEFREWYATRHIRHALNIPALVSGQCLGRTLFQKPGAAEPSYNIIAVYEQEGTPQSIIESFASLPAGTLNFPMLDRSRFAEACYRPI